MSDTALALEINGNGGVRHRLSQQPHPGFNAVSDTWLAAQHTGIAPAMIGAVTESLVDTTETRYQVGQRWRYRTRPGEEGSYLTVLKVEAAPSLGVIVHVRVDGLRIENSDHPDGVIDTIGHLPMAESALDESVTALDAGEVPAGSEDGGYQEWRGAFDAGEAGIWTITVSQAIDHIAQVVGGAQAS